MTTNSLELIIQCLEIPFPKQNLLTFIGKEKLKKKIEQLVQDNVDLIDIILLKYLLASFDKDTTNESYYFLIQHIGQKLTKYSEFLSTIYNYIYESALSNGFLFKSIIEISSWMNNICKSLVSSKYQIQYHSLFILWKLSFDKNKFLPIDEKYFVVKNICELIRNSSKIKIKRLIISILNNYSNYGHQVAINLTRYQIQEYLEIDDFKDSKDRELQTELGELKRTLHEYLSKISTFQAYLAELRSGTLEWTPLHKSSLFWKNNISRFDENDHECLRLLLSLISSSKLISNILIALNDIQNYINFKTKPKK
jgi:hypothetical protein